MALDEAKGAEAQAEQLAACPGMTVESARAVLAAGSGKAEPVSASTTAMFEHFMANHSPAAVQGGVPQTSADGDADAKRSWPCHEVSADHQQEVFTIW